VSTLHVVPPNAQAAHPYCDTPSCRARMCSPVNLWSQEVVLDADPRARGVRKACNNVRLNREICSVSSTVNTKNDGLPPRLTRRNIDHLQQQPSSALPNTYSEKQQAPNLASHGPVRRPPVFLHSRAIVRSVQARAHVRSVPARSIA
jgi:hypothetical protein